LLRGETQMECAIAVATFIKVIFDIFAPCVKMFSDNSGAKRQLRAEAESSMNKYLGSELRRLATEFRLQAEQKQSATRLAVIVFLLATVVSCAVFPTKTVLVGAIGVSFALGGLLLPEANRIAEYAKQGLRRTAGLWHSASQKMRVEVLRCAQQMRSRIRDWKWESIPVSRIFRTTP
jgi:hypothetical protein